MVVDGYILRNRPDLIPRQRCRRKGRSGLISRLDYLKCLGVDAIWLTPIYRSPMLDLGYDIADFCAVDPIYGTLRDFDQLVSSLRRLILEFVPNHTSDQHVCFKESTASRANAKEDWYIWTDAPENGRPPINWLSRFGGSAWEWSEQRQQYYYHSFLVEQPDLNWRNAKVRSAMFDVMRFWLRGGVDGFRIDASAVLIKITCDATIQSILRLTKRRRRRNGLNRYSPMTDRRLWPASNKFVRCLTNSTTRYWQTKCRERPTGSGNSTTMKSLACTCH
jgi:1,4-alpha-glucan branching enzyme